MKRVRIMKNRKSTRIHLLRVIWSGNAFINTEHYETQAFDLMNCGCDKHLPPFYKTAPECISLYAAFVLAAYDAGDL